MVSTLTMVDEQVSYGIQRLVQVLPSLWKAIAIFGVYSVPVILVWYWFAHDRLTALRSAVAGIVAWFGFNTVLSHLIDRQRPPQIPSLHFPAQEFLFDRPGPSFPSDHAAFMTAVALSFFLAGDRKVAVYLGLIATLSLLARIVTAQHWVGDIVAGIVLGIVAAVIVHAVRNPLDRRLLQPLITSVRKLGV